MAIQHELWGPETGKAIENFPVSGEPIPAPVARWLGRIKAAAARVNAELGLLDAEKAERVAAAADRVAAGELDVESWLTSELPTAELRRAMKRVKGVGDYAAENLLKLVGRYDVLALDSWVRATYARLHNRGRACDDQKIARHYARFGHWRGLALWCDMTKDWIEEK